MKLVDDGYAHHIIVPEYSPTSGKQGKNNSMSEPSQYPRYFENTHRELLLSKTIMDRSGYNSAILVSSAHHMRRLRIIAEKVFGKGKYDLCFVPSRYERETSVFWFLTPRLLKFVSSEYVKIAWFGIYNLLPVS